MSERCSMTVTRRCHRLCGRSPHRQQLRRNRHPDVPPHHHQDPGHQEHPGHQREGRPSATPGHHDHRLPGPRPGRVRAAARRADHHRQPERHSRRPAPRAASGCTVDFEDHLRPFYFGSCSFRPTEAGLSRTMTMTAWDMPKRARVRDILICRSERGRQVAILPMVGSGCRQLADMLAM